MATEQPSVVRTRHAVERLKWTLARESHRPLRELARAGPAAEIAWPNDLPALTGPVQLWLAAWSVRTEGQETVFMETDLGPGGVAYRPLYDAGAAAARLRELREEGRVGASWWVPILEDVFVDMADHDTVWTLAYEHDVERPVRVAEDLAELALLLERRFAARRASPLRRVRIETVGGAFHRAPLPDASTLDTAPEGTALVFRWAPNARRVQRGMLSIELYAKRGSSWIRGSGAATRPPMAGCPTPDEIASAIDRVRHDLYEADLQPIPSDELAKVLTARVHSWGQGEPWGLCEGRVRLWDQPPLSALLARFSLLLRERFPEVAAGLSPPFTKKEDLAALEREIGGPLPAELEALFRFANGQREESPTLNNRYRLCSAEEAASTMKRMKDLRDRHGFPRLYWDDGLVPFLETLTGDYLAVDVAGAYGPAGAIVDFNHEDSRFRTVLHDSLTNWLECFVDGLERGLWSVDDNALSCWNRWDEVKALEADRSTGYPDRIRYTQATTSPP